MNKEMRVYEERTKLANPPCSVEYCLWGKCGPPPYRWALVERRSTLKEIERDEKDYRSWMDESGWHDFAIVKHTRTEEILSPNVERRHRAND